MNKKQIVVQSADPDLKLELLRTIDESTEFELCAFTDNIRDFELILDKLKPEVALITCHEDNPSDFNAVKLAAAEKYKPLIAIVSDIPRIDNSYKLKDVMNRIVIAPPYEGNLIYGAISSSLNDEKHNMLISVAIDTEKRINERLANIFISSGIPPHIKGYSFLREAVKQTVSDPTIINSITKRLYPAIAQKYDTTPSKVERAIRHAIEVAWMRGKIENINELYGVKIFGKGDKPTNGELIALISDRLIIECC